MERKKKGRRDEETKRRLVKTMFRPAFFLLFCFTLLFCSAILQLHVLAFFSFLPRFIDHACVCKLFSSFFSSLLSSFCLGRVVFFLFFFLLLFYFIRHRGGG